jgi:hypothetical protein
MNTCLRTLVTLACFASATVADITGTFVPVAIENGQSPPVGFKTSDLAVTATTDWLAGNLIIDLDQGSINQSNLIVGIGPPAQALIDAIPSTRWDTYVSNKAGVAGGSPASAGGAVDLGGTQAGKFDTSGIDINWFNTTSNDIGTFTIGRFTLSDDAHGTFVLRLDSLRQDAPFLFSGSIKGGEFIVVPEAGTLAMSVLGLVLGALGVARTRRAR